MKHVVVWCFSMNSLNSVNREKKGMCELSRVMQSSYYHTIARGLLSYDSTCFSSFLNILIFKRAINAMVMSVLIN